jgi:hypothetical protein
MDEFIIAPMMIVCGKRYVETATISIPSFLEHHNEKLFVIIDEIGKEILSNLISDSNLIFIDIKEILERCVCDVNIDFKNFVQMPAYGEKEIHDRKYSTLKPIIMEWAIKSIGMPYKFILSLDSDTFFSGNIIDKIKTYLKRPSYKKADLFLVERTDNRMSLLNDMTPGSGFTLWRRKSKFINIFKTYINADTASIFGGSQGSIVNIFNNNMIHSKLFTDHLLHFVSPDRIKGEMIELTDKQILSIAPAYIHLHGPNSYKRLLKFESIFKKRGASKMIAPIMIVHGKLYCKMAIIAIDSFLKHHPDEVIYVAVGGFKRKLFDRYLKKNVRIIDLKQYCSDSINDVGYDKFDRIKHGDELFHDRTYSALKPLIMDKIIAEKCPQANYVLSLDADTIFTGNIMDKIYKYLNSVDHRFDLYQVARTDLRMHLNHGYPGSGFTLWKRNSKFIELFLFGFNNNCTKTKGGGSQGLIRKLSKFLSFHIIDDPLLHFVSPDTKNPKITAKEILKLKPAYIHLHGKKSYKRLVRFQRIFNKENSE